MEPSASAACHEAVLSAHDLAPPIVSVVNEGPERFAVIKRDGAHRFEAQIIVSRVELEALLASAAEQLELTRQAHEGNLRERARQAAIDARQASLFGEEESP